MSYKKVKNKMMINIKKYYQYIKGCTIEYDLTPYQIILKEINQLRSEFENKSDDELKNISKMLINRASDNECLDNILVEAFALVREAIQRVLKINAYDVQIISGIAMHQGKLAEMQTGEGKTLAAVFPIYLNALSGEGVHVLTFNDYLARRDAQWMGSIYNFLGLSVAVVQEGMAIQDRQRAYNSDITYLTAKECGFDFLRDSLSYDQDGIVHRNFNFAVIDEADSILIDEARIPLIIAETMDDYIVNTYNMTHIVQQLKEKIDFEFDEYYRNIYLTENGIKRVEEMLNFTNLYDEKNIEILTQLNYALHAEYLLQVDRDYIVRNGKVELVDEFTGRVADKRRWPDGLQAAIEAKEKLMIQAKGRQLNTITVQNFLQLYPKICGMTATAQIAEEEFKEFYNLHVVVIPPNRSCIRHDFDDVIFHTRDEKQKALIREIIHEHKIKRPILVGTGSVEESAILADALGKEGVQFEVLNAKKDEYEAKIIAEAGKLGAVTIATNMAGRGTDIRLGGSDEDQMKQVVELGGLYVIGTNKHESSRIDNQLRGRAGRQGDPGSSCFFISIDDDIFVRYRLKDIIASKYIYNVEERRIDNPFIRKMINHIQRVIEGQNLEIKKTLCKYSSLVEKQRNIIFQKRTDILCNDTIIDFYESKSSDQFNQMMVNIGKRELIKFCKHVSLLVIDKLWSRYLAEIAEIRESIHLERIGGQEPVYKFYKQSIELFDKLQENIEIDMIQQFNNFDVNNNFVDLYSSRLKAPSATLTYLVSDNPFEDRIVGMHMLGNVGFNAMAGLLWPFLVLYPFLRKVLGKKVRDFNLFQ